MVDKDKERFSEEETQVRFEAALRGARIAGAKHKSAPKRILGKVETTQTKPKTKR